MTKLGSKHQSVMAQEALDALAVASGEGVYVDATFGDGGHSHAILQRLGPQGRLLALDRDRQAIEQGGTLVEDYSQQLLLIHTPFSQLQEVMQQHGITTLQGVLFDLGVSSRQLDEAQRGFSFQADGPLDMRMDQPMDQHDVNLLHTADAADVSSNNLQPLTAAMIVNTYAEDRLADIFFRYGEERYSRRIAQAIVMDRQQQPFSTTRQLASLLERIMPRKRHNRGKRGVTIHPATRVFQALRIAVNHELQELQTALDTALHRLAVGAKVVVISFHSLEDRIVKQTFRQAVNPQASLLGPEVLLQPQTQIPRFRLVTRKPQLPSAAEIASNPRSRSARMRVIECLSGLEKGGLEKGGLEKGRSERSGSEKGGTDRYAAPKQRRLHHAQVLTQYERFS